ncbi:carbonic anhydrase [Roseivirga sp. BDSF3-8]|uniref:carbonic anhydrase n=1 Tax=Roseivirga sp. BDSF3-8 TaxID=3241598 RepID=UPI0035320A96
MVNSSEALKLLKEGNKSYREGKSAFPNTDVARRDSVVGSQEPFAVIIGCADSRVVPELVFDTGIGDLFVIRVAGNIIDDAVTASIEYAVSNLGTKLVVVLGHESCGAVTAAVNEVKGGHLDALTKAIRPAVETASKQDGDKVDNAIRQNAVNMTNLLRNSEPVIKDMVENKGVEVVPAYYSLSTGEVEFINVDQNHVVA